MKAENESGFIVPPHMIEHSEGITGMSEIYVSQSGFFRISIARHLGRKVIIKSLKPECAANPLALQQLNKEFALAFPIESRYVSRLLASVSLADGTPAIEMEFCQGDTLRALFDRDCRFTPVEASGIVTSLLHGLEDIHRSGVVHRDIKPSNIMLDRDSMSLKIIDFGCAHSYDYVSLSGPAGTIAYTPPEKRHGTADPQPADDLYAAGMVFLELAGYCTDRRMSSRLESLGKAMSSRNFSTARDALDFFNRSKTGKTHTHLMIAAVAVVTAAGAFFLLSPHTETTGNTTTEIPPGDDSTRTVISQDAAHPEPADTPYTEHTGRTSAAADNPETGDIESTLAGEGDRAPATNESDEELRRMAVQAGPMVLRAKEKYASDRIRGDAFAITSADSIYMHHLYEEFPKGSHTDRSLRAAIDSIYRAECPRLEKEYRRRAGKTYDTHRFRILFTSRLDYMLKFYGATMSGFKSD